MSKYDAMQLEWAALCINGKKIATDHGAIIAELDGTVIADMLDAYAATLEQQAEWPSDADVIRAWGVLCESKEIADATTRDKNMLPHMRAALRSVRPPASRHARQVPEGEVRLWDTQWTNIVNHDNCYRDWEKADAINHAVKMTEQAIARNLADGKLPQARIAAAPPAPEKD